MENIGIAGRTMDFTFDVSQTPVIGRRFLKVNKPEENLTVMASPRRSCSLSPADTGLISGWKRSWLSQVKLHNIFRVGFVHLITTQIP